MAKIEQNSLFTAVSEEESSTVSGGDGGGIIPGLGLSVGVDGSGNITYVIGPDGILISVTTSSTSVTTSSTSVTTSSTSGTGTTSNTSIVTPGVPGTGL